MLNTETSYGNVFADEWNVGQHIFCKHK